MQLLPHKQRQRLQYHRYDDHPHPVAKRPKANRSTVKVLHDSENLFLLNFRQSLLEQCYQMPLGIRRRLESRVWFVGPASLLLVQK